MVKVRRCILVNEPPASVTLADVIARRDSDSPVQNRETVRAIALLRAHRFQETVAAFQNGVRQ